MILSPLGDQAGEMAKRPSASLKRRLRFDASGLTVQSAPSGSPRALATRIVVPSGDQRIVVPTFIRGGVSRLTPVPSTVTTHAEPTLCVLLSRKNARRLPSGEKLPGMSAIVGSVRRFRFRPSVEPM